jgi:uncharacterized membrane protein YgcG
MLRELDQAKPCDVSSVLWGYAKLRIPGSPGKVFLQAATDHLAVAIDAYSCQELVQCLWACATLGHYPGQSALRAVEARLLARCALLTPQDASNALWAFAALHHKPAGLLDALPLAFGRRLGAFKPQELSCVLHGYVSARHYHAALLDAAAPLLLLRAPRLSHVDVVVALRAYGLFGHRPRIDARALAAAAAWELGSEGGSSGGGGGGRGGDSIRSGGIGDGMGGGSVDSGGGGRATSPLPPPGSTSTSSAAPPPPALHPRSRGGVAHGHEHEHDARSSALSSLVAALASNARRRLPHLRPRALTSLVSALAGVRHASSPRCDLRGLAAEAGRLAAARASDLRPHELSALLYGLSSLRVGEMSAYHACVRQLTRALEDDDHAQPGALGSDEHAHGVQRGAGQQQHRHQQQQYDSHHSGSGGGCPRRGAVTARLLTSVVHSCVSVGYTPWALIESAALRGVLLRADPASMATRWQLPTRTPPARRVRLARPAQQQQQQARRPRSSSSAEQQGGEEEDAGARPAYYRRRPACTGGGRRVQEEAAVAIAALHGVGAPRHRSAPDDAHEHASSAVRSAVGSGGGSIRSESGERTLVTPGCTIELGLSSRRPVPSRCVDAPLRCARHAPRAYPAGRSKPNTISTSRASWTCTPVC